MGIMFVFYFIGLGLALVATIGLLTLAIVPAFRVTRANLIAFIIGGIVGMFALANLIEPSLVNRGLYSNMAITKQNNLHIAFDSLWAFIGGTTLVSLKTVWLKIKSRPR
jgi:hypothetical protein